MTSDFRVGRGVQNDPKNGRFRVEKGTHWSESRLITSFK